MTRPLSNDLRKRVVSAVDGGMSRRAAAERFGVAVSTAIKWVARWRSTGNVRPRAQGGDKRSRPIEVHAGEILSWVAEKPDMTLAEITLQLTETHGLKVAPSSVWRFLDRHGMTVKKPRTPASNSVLTFCADAGVGSRPSPISTRSGWCSSTKPERRPKWRGAMAGRCAANAAARRCRMVIGRPPPSSARCGSGASPHPCCSTAPCTELPS